MLRAVGTCNIGALMQAVDALTADGDVGMEKDDFFAMVRSLPDLRTGEMFRPVEDILDRIYRSFQATNRTDVFQVRAMQRTPPLSRCMTTPYRSALFVDRTARDRLPCAAARRCPGEG